MKILLCGSEGFLGKNLTRLLAPTHEIVPFDPKFGDDMTHFEKVARAMQGKGAAFMFGSRAVGRRNMEKRPDAKQIDTAGTRNFAEAALEAKVPLVFASSIRVYGSEEEMKGGEGRRPHPADSYGEMKLACEDILAEYKSRGLRYAALRMAAVYGPGMPEDFIVSYFFSCILQGRPIVLRSSPEVERNFIFIEDIAGAIERILAWGIPSPEIFNIVSEKSVTLRTLAEYISRTVGKPYEILQSGAEEGISERNLPIIKVRSTAGWHPAVSLEEGLEKTYAYRDA